MKRVSPAGRVWLFALLLAAMCRVMAAEPFTIEDIRVEGLQRIAVGTVFNYLPLKKGDVLDDKSGTAAIRALYKTGFFSDVVLEREGDVLIVFVKERPAIASIEIDGNEKIPSEQLKDSLKRIGFAEGRVFDRSMLDRVELELKQQYLAMGKYSVKIKSTVTPLERNRVAIRIDIAEGSEASIKHLHIVGAKAYSESELLEELNLGTHSPLQFFSSQDDKYSKQKLGADLEVLRSHYMNSGYLNFEILSTQVSVTPDHHDVYITIAIFEGNQYRIKDVKLAGDLILPEEELRKLISLKSGDIFSRKEITESTSRISERLGDSGYAFANVNPVPDVDEEKREVSLTFFVDPGKRVTVRRINITGNSKTQDEVLRRELRQMEGGVISTEQIKRSRTRLNRLGFFEDVNIETPTVPGTQDQVDINVAVKERQAFGSLNFGIGYGDTQGFLINSSVSQDNFLGTGNRFSLDFNNSKVNTVYSFSMTNPYYTMDGVSRTLNLSYRTTDVNAATNSKYSYTTDAYGGGVMFGVPVTEYDTMRYGFNYENTTINTTASTSRQILDFCIDNASAADCSFEAYKLSSSLTHDTRDKTIFADSGNMISLSGEVATPISDSALNFYKLRYSHKNYSPVRDGITFTTSGELSYANVYGNSQSLAPFERYYAGGSRSIRGYRSNRVGALSTIDPATNIPLGGNARALANMELLFRPPFAEKSNSSRLSLFIDAGNVYDSAQLGWNKELLLDAAHELRYSAGVGFYWITPVGPLSFSYARPFNAQPWDSVERFQFTLGTPY
ncbi:MAG TPA: outer membrane protein assembly factor BamA [Gammaproteobacteria bacterium]